MSKNILNVIEQKYPVETISYKGQNLWPLLRLKINESVRNKDGLKSRTLKIRWALIVKLSLSWLYGLRHLLLLKRYSIWAFSSSDRRKKINSKYVDRVLGGVIEKFPSTLIIENPYPLNKHYKKRETDSTNIISLSLFWGMGKIISFLLKRNLKIENEELLIKIIKEYGIEINYKETIKNYRAQYLLFSFILNYVKPKFVIFVYSASSMGYIKAFKERKIPVIEFQHGVINKSHHAYNIPKNFGQELFPDYLFSYGSLESEIFDDTNFFIDKKRVIPIGYFYLDRMLSEPSNSKRQNELRHKYDTIVTYSLQEPFEDYIFKFLIEVARLDTSICYLAVPRDISRSYSKYKVPDNVIIEKELNVYECLKISDFHSTINSTCAIESLCFGVPNLLYNYKGWAFNYYKDLLGSDCTKYVATAEEFLHNIKNIIFPTKEDIIIQSKKYVYSNFDDGIETLLKSDLFKEI